VIFSFISHFPPPNPAELFFLIIFFLSFIAKSGALVQGKNYQHIPRVSSFTYYQSPVEGLVCGVKRIFAMRRLSSRSLFGNKNPVQ
jgi:hypothetical protein